MKHDCDIVRDLMPLCIDGAASENSRHMVGEHVLECRDCMEVYQEMRTELPKEPPVSKADAPFGRTVRKLRKQRNRRRLAAGIAGALAGIILFAVLASVYATLTTDYALMADDRDYGFSLSRRTNGQIVVTHENYSGKEQDVRWEFDGTTGILKFYAVTPTWALKAEQASKSYIYNELYWDAVTGKLMILVRENGSEVSKEVKEVYKGAKNRGYGYVYQVLYVQGRDIPMADADIDASYPVEGVPQAYRHIVYGFATVTPAPAQETITPAPTKMADPTPAPRAP